MKSVLFNLGVVLISSVLIFSCAGKKKTVSTTEGKTSEDATAKLNEEKIGSEQGEALAQGGSSKLGKAGAPNQAADMLERVYFDFDDANLRGDAREILKKDAEVLKQNQSVNISIEGHCDERGSVEYNLALAERRAEGIKKYLATLGISNQRMSTISYGEEKPLVQGHSEDAWAKNRRGELVVK